METLFPGLAASPALHPLVVHFPVALWVVALLFWGIAAIRKDHQLWRVGRGLLVLGTLGGLAAIGSGLLATRGMDHGAAGHDLVHAHRDLMLVATALAAAVTLLSFALWNAPSSLARWGQLTLLAAAVFVMGMGADRGAMLAHGETPKAQGKAPVVADAHGHHDHHGHAH